MLSKTVVTTDSPFLTADRMIEVIRANNAKTASLTIDTISALERQSLGLYQYFNKIGKVKKAENDEPKVANVIGIVENKVELLSYRNRTPNEFGRGKATEVVVFRFDLFDVGHIIASHNKQYQLQVVGKLGQSDGGFAYEVKLYGTPAYFPTSILESSRYFSVVSAPVSRTHSIRGPGVRYTTPSTRTFYMTTIRVSDDVPGDAKFIPVKLEWMNAAGKSQYVWDDQRTVTNDMAFNKIINDTMMYSLTTFDENGRHTNDVDPFNKRKIESGEGLIPQLMRGNSGTYNYAAAKAGHIDIIDIILNKVKSARMGKQELNVSQRMAVLGGTIAIDLAATSMEKRAHSWTNITDKFYGGNQGSLMIGAKFVSYMSPTGFILDFVYEKSMDVDAVAKTLYDGANATSAKFIILDIGTTSNGSETVDNIYIEESPRHNKTFAIQQGPIGGSGEGYRTAMLNRVDAYNKSFQTEAFQKTGYKKPMPQSVATMVDAWEETRIHAFRVMVMNPSATLMLDPV